MGTINKQQQLNHDYITRREGNVIVESELSAHLDNTVEGKVTSDQYLLVETNPIFIS